MTIAFQFGVTHDTVGDSLTWVWGQFGSKFDQLGSVWRRFGVSSESVLRQFWAGLALFVSR